MQLQMSHLFTKLQKKISFPNKTPPFISSNTCISVACLTSLTPMAASSVRRFFTHHAGGRGCGRAGRRREAQDAAASVQASVKDVEKSSPLSYQYHLKIFMSDSTSSFNEIRNQYQINLSNQINITMYNLLYNLGFWDAAKVQSWYKIDSFWWRCDFSRPCIAIFQDSPMDVFRHQKNST